MPRTRAVGARRQHEFVAAPKPCCRQTDRSPQFCKAGHAARVSPGLRIDSSGIAARIESSSAPLIYKRQIDAVRHELDEPGRSGRWRTIPTVAAVAQWQSSRLVSGRSSVRSRPAAPACIRYAASGQFRCPGLVGRVRRGPRCRQFIRELQARQSRDALVHGRRRRRSDQMRPPKVREVCEQQRKKNVPHRQILDQRGRSGCGA
jgi:hypothetical protein